MHRLIYFGPPGTGKTATLLNHLEEVLRAGTAPDRVAFLTFTRRAKKEALDRVEQALGVRPDELPFFRTIHSMAYRALRLKDGDVMGREALNEFGALMGLEFGAGSVTEQAAEGLYSQSKGDHLLAIDNLARLGSGDPIAVWREARSPYDRLTVEQFCDSYRLFKEERGLLDFTDVLLRYVEHGAPLPVDVVFVDEAQDLSALQWQATLQAASDCQQMFVAGDDDQAIYRWAGADVRVFQNLVGEQCVLSFSHRLPRSVHRCASAILERIKQRVPKTFHARDAEGRVVWHPTEAALDIKQDDRWLWLVRNRYLMQPLREQLLNQGYVVQTHGASSVVEGEQRDIYAWERLRAGKRITAVAARDVYARLRSRTQIKHGFKLLPALEDDDTVSLAELHAHHGLLSDGAWFDVFESIPLSRRAYYRRLLRLHGTLKIAPQVTLETIHGAKGAQADKVALFLEQSRRTYEDGQRTPDDEHRVWYVGATRAKEELHLIGGPNTYRYSFPRVTT